MPSLRLDLRGFAAGGWLDIGATHGRIRIAAYRLSGNNVGLIGSEKADYPTIPALSHKGRGGLARHSAKANVFCHG
jgi:hypothetical protein